MMSDLHRPPSPSGAWCPGPTAAVRRAVLCCLLGGMALGTVPAAKAHAQFVRVELPSPVTQGVPSRFEEVSARVLAAGMPIAWQEPPSYLPHFTGGGGAMLGTISVEIAPGMLADLTWIRLDTLAQRDQYVSELTSSYGADGYMQWASDGLHVLQVYAHDYDPSTARDVLHRLQVR